MNTETLAQLENKIRRCPECWEVYTRIQALLMSDLRLFWSLKELLDTLHRSLHSDEGV